jgi:hypothetical protein
VDELIGGGLFGLIGGLGGRIVEIFVAKEKRKADAERFQHELKMRELEGVLKRQETEDELLVNAQTIDGKLKDAIVSGEYAGLVESIKQEASIKGSPWMDNIRGLVRPVILMFLAASTMYTYNVAVDKLSTQEAVAQTWLGLFVTAVLWYFGSRDYQNFNIFKKR